MNSDRLALKTSALDEANNQSTNSKFQELKECEMSEDMELNLDSEQ
jgi:hypothetical protein